MLNDWVTRGGTGYVDVKTGKGNTLPKSAVLPRNLQRGERSANATRVLLRERCCDPVLTGPRHTASREPPYELRPDVLSCFIGDKWH